MKKHHTLKIFHIDNDPDTLSSVKTILEREGYEVTSATSGEETISAVKSGTFDLLLLDIMMPDLSGWDVFSRITKLRPNQKVAFLTVFEISEKRKKALLKVGVAEYFLKPIKVDDFIKRIKKII